MCNGDTFPMVNQCTEDIQTDHGFVHICVHYLFRFNKVSIKEEQAVMGNSKILLKTTLDQGVVPVTS